MQRLIGLYSSAPQSGKTFAASILNKKGFDVISLAEPIRNMAVEFLVGIGYTAEEALRLVKTDKEKNVPEIGKSVRFLLQTLGTEWGRNLIHENIWIISLQMRAQQKDQIVVDDVRFENEAAIIKEMGGEMWWIQRKLVTNSSDHISNGALDKWNGFDRYINNNSTLDNFGKKINQLI